eukprot:COSAG06_NODE_6110_length_3105_cov_213.753160_2_plen_63_part_00
MRHGWHVRLSLSVSVSESVRMKYVSAQMSDHCAVAARRKMMIMEPFLDLEAGAHCDAYVAGS